MFTGVAASSCEGEEAPCVCEPALVHTEHGPHGPGADGQVPARQRPLEPRPRYTR